MSQATRLLEALETGSELTAAQIRSRFSAQNPYEVVRQVRAMGNAVYCNERTNSKGETKSFYRLGTPSRAMVSAFYRMGGAQS